MKAIFLTVIALSILTACATPYQSESLLGGYSDTRLAPDVFRIRFSGNAYTSGERAQDFALLRAADLAQQHGYSYFAVIDERSSSTVSAFSTPGHSSSSGSGYISSGGSFTYSGQTTYYPGQTFFFYKPNTGMLIRCFERKPDAIFTFDVAFLEQSLRQKYGLEPSWTSRPVSASVRTPSSPRENIKEESDMSHFISFPSRKDALGYKVYTSKGKYLGQVVAVFDTDGKMQYVVEQEGKKNTYVIDATSEFFKEIDMKLLKMIVVGWH